MTTELVPHGSATLTSVPDVTSDLQLVAVDAEQMKVAQQRMALWFAGKEEISRRDHVELRTCVEQGKAAGLNVSTLTRQARVALKRAEFYEKCKLACEAGYCLVPNMPASTFAIRTLDSGVRHAERQTSTSPYRKRPGTTRDYADNLPAGEGDYFDTFPRQSHGSFERIDPRTGKPETVYFTDPDGLQEVQFPLAVAKPAVMAETVRAMQLKVFDELQILPGRNTRKGDPLVLGTIAVPSPSRKPWDETRVTFLIAWYIDTRTLP